MIALITGASSGIGRDIARELSRRGYDLIIVARRKKRLLELKAELGDNVKVIDLDVSKKRNCIKLYNKVKKEDIDILVNNAGFGVRGLFEETDLDRELELIDVNIRAVHILTKLFLKDMKEKDSGYILNVASSAAFAAGPLMAAYYASKAYILRLTNGIYGELKKSKSNVVVSALCPGPVLTEFNDVAKVKFAMDYLPSEVVAKYAVKKLFKKKPIIIPGYKMKFNYFLSKVAPLNLALDIVYNNQKKK